MTLYLLQLYELGWLFVKVNKFLGRMERGLMSHAFASSLREDLADYFRLIAVLDFQLARELNVLTIDSLSHILREVMASILLLAGVKGGLMPGRRRGRLAAAPARWPGDKQDPTVPTAERPATACAPTRCPRHHGSPGEATTH